MTNPHNKIPPGEGRLILSLYKEGKTGRAIAKQFGRPANTIYDYISRHGGCRGVRGRRRLVIDEATFRKRWRDGASYDELKAEFGLRSNSSIWNLRTKFGLPQHVRRNSPSRKYDVKELERLRKSGVPVSEIAKRHGTCYQYIYYLLKLESPIINEPRVTVPQARLELRDALYERQYKDLTAALMGDPLPGRRELLERYA